MVIKRDFYVDKLKSVRHNGLVKVITGVRRCGKSYLLFNLYRDALKAEGVGDTCRRRPSTMPSILDCATRGSTSARLKCPISWKTRYATSCFAEATM